MQLGSADATFPMQQASNLVQVRAVEVEAEDLSSQDGAPEVRRNTMCRCCICCDNMGDMQLADAGLWHALWAAKKYFIVSRLEQQ